MNQKRNWLVRLMIDCIVFNIIVQIVSYKMSPDTILLSMVFGVLALAVILALLVYLKNKKEETKN